MKNDDFLKCLRLLLYPTNCEITIVYYDVAIKHLKKLREVLMNMNYIVRADYYPNGEIVPLGITDYQGNSLYLKKLTTTKRAGKQEFRFECLTSNGQRIVLLFLRGRWIVE